MTRQRRPVAPVGSDTREARTPPASSRLALRTLQATAGNAALVRVQRVIMRTADAAYVDLTRASWYKELDEAGKQKARDLHKARRRYTVQEAKAEIGPPHRGGRPDDGNRPRNRKRRREDPTDKGKEIEGEGDEDLALDPKMVRRWRSLDEQAYFLDKTGVGGNPARDTPTKTRQRKERSTQLPCWNWTLTALTSTGASPDAIFGYLNEGDDASAAAQAKRLSGQIEAGLVDDLRRIRRKMAKHGLTLKLKGLQFEEALDELARRRELLADEENREMIRRFAQRATEVCVKAHGFEIDETSSTKVVMQFKPVNGVTADHWWLEVEGIHLQTVPNISFIRIDALMTEEEGLRAGTVLNIEVPVKTFKREHVRFLNQAMAGATPKTNPPPNTVFD